ncbi:MULTISPECIES: polyphosphate kinase 1 [Nonlabens]|uniref:Polyphosphate kinase n=5 Tax=Nonlabens ulvanivorans TaxID=906888 RepID=A0A084JW66_NONUL|nr:polyphosphate kinase 1 [Nonlabens ulvanivorans]KEZ93200.1 polyphosphate kinase [Nonlabens ulvanivorans]PRX13678.1 polyphosphate kinase [Nonlabens ulvanivorans]
MSPRYFNRELSWLKFNNRVLQEAADINVPLIERLRFLGIFSNNLDEFFRVRYATIQRILRAGKNATKSLGGVTAADLLEKITAEVIKDQAKSFEVLNQLEEELRNENIILVDETEILPQHENYIRSYFNNYVSPALATIMVSDESEFPTLRDGLGYLAVRMVMKDSSLPVRYALLEIPKSLNRFIELPSIDGDDKQYIILLDDLIRDRMHYIFNIFEYSHLEAHMIKVTLDAELDIDIDLKKSLIEKISRSVKDRKDGDPVRFVYDKSIHQETLDFIMSKVEIDDTDSIIPGGRYHNRRDYLKFPSLGRTDLLYEKKTPLPIKGVSMRGSLLEKISQRDILQYAPYHTFSNTVKFLREAALDPKVLNIKITIYRLAEVSQIAASLINAAKNGKEVTVSIELQARFDEQANINYAELMQEEGVKLIFGVPGLKVHCKACVINREEDGKIVRYGFISTGNFNEATAGIYTDYTLFTANKKILKEVDKVFDFFEVNYKLYRYKHLLVSPHSLRNNIEKKVRREIAFAKAGKKAHLRMKLNSFSDFKMIELFYEASNAGVQIDLIIRGICCLIPGVIGMSENIKVISIVDKYLEHPRVYQFYNDGDVEVYISSADMMGRNLDNRVEIACPIYDESVKKEILDTLDICWNDNVKAREICSEQLNLYVKQDDSPIRSQFVTYDYYKNQL